MKNPDEKAFPDAAIIGQDFRVLSKQAIFDRLNAMVPAPGAISRTGLLAFAKTAMPGWPEDIANEAQRRLSKAFYWLDTGRLRIGYYRGKGHVFLKGEAIRNRVAKNPPAFPDKVTPSIQVGADGVSIRWR